MDEWQRARSLFQTLWGYDGFRGPQGDIIQTILQGRDLWALLPTGTGKSLCFQLPALLRSGLTVVVSPLVSLMDRQVADLRAKGLPAATLHSEVPRSQQKEVLDRLERGQLRLLYLSPETLFSQRVWSRLLRLAPQIQGLAIDEAHCLAQWGETFRPAYRRLGIARQTLEAAAQKPIPIAAFTATATPTDRAIIAQVLGLRNPARFEQSPYRANLRLQVQRCWVPAQRQWRLRRWLRDRPGQGGLIFARSRQTCEDLARNLRDRGHQTAAYHAGLPPPDRRRLEAQWVGGELPFLVCTSAFGMGIDRPDVRWIVHWHRPLIPAEYVQEIGRAGRDGQPADILLLVSEPTGWLDSTDRRLDRHFQQQTRQQIQNLGLVARRLPQEGAIAEIADQFAEGAIALSWLHALGQLDWLDPFHYKLSGQLSGQWSATIARQARMGRSVELSMRRYGGDRGCRWRFLLQALGLPPKSANWRCGQCDRCRHTGQR